MTEGKDDRVVLVTGAARRIGAAIARRLHGSGLRVLLHYHGSEAAVTSLAAELNDLRPHSASALKANLLELAAIEQLAQDARAVFGRLDFLVNNASTFYPTPVGKIRPADWEDLIGTNLKAPLFLIQACSEELRARKGAIVNITDIHVLRPPAGYIVYTIAKSGLWTLTQGLAQELGPSVRVNAVAPGAILLPEDTVNIDGHHGMVAKTPLARAGDPNEIASTVLFLLCHASYVTGQIIPVDGGRSVVS